MELRTRRWLALTFCAALALGACGSDSDSDSDTGTGGAPQDEEGVETTPDMEESNPVADDEAGDGAVGGGGPAQGHLSPEDQTEQDGTGDNP